MTAHIACDIVSNRGQYHSLNVPAVGFHQVADDIPAKYGSPPHQPYPRLAVDDRLVIGQEDRL